MELKKKETFSKRRRKQQLYQRLVICGVVVLLLGIVGVGSSLPQIGKGTENAVRTSKDADSRKSETVKYEGESIEEKQKESQNKEETQEEKVERVREPVSFVEDYEEKKIRHVRNQSVNCRRMVRFRYCSSGMKDGAMLHMERVLWQSVDAALPAWQWWHPV